MRHAFVRNGRKLGPFVLSTCLGMIVAGCVPEEDAASRDARLSEQVAADARTYRQMQTERSAVPAAVRSRPERHLVCHYDADSDIYEALRLPDRARDAHLQRHEHDTAAVERYADLDGDGFGDGAAGALLVCDGPQYADNDLDCDDTDPAVNPSASELGGNRTDENCDGVIGDDPGEESDPTVERGRVYSEISDNTGVATFALSSGDRPVTLEVLTRDSITNSPVANVTVNAVELDEGLFVWNDGVEPYAIASALIPYKSAVTASADELTPRLAPLAAFFVVLNLVGNITNVYELVTDPPELDIVSRGAGVYEVCVTGDLNDLFAIGGLVGGTLASRKMYLRVLEVGGEATEAGAKLLRTYGLTLPASLRTDAFIGALLEGAQKYEVCLLQVDLRNLVGDTGTIDVFTLPIVELRITPALRRWLELRHGVVASSYSLDSDTNMIPPPPGRESLRSLEYEGRLLFYPDDQPLIRPDTSTSLSVVYDSVFLDSRLVRELKTFESGLTVCASTDEGLVDTLFLVTDIGEEVESRTRPPIVGTASYSTAGDCGGPGISFTFRATSWIPLP